MIEPGMKTLRSASLACALALIWSSTASAEIVAPGVQSGILALSANGTPNVAYVHGTKVVVASRVSKGNWRHAAAAAVALGSRVMAFEVGSAGPVVLAQSVDDRSLVLIRRVGTSWRTIRLAGGLPSSVRLGWPGLTLDGQGLPVVAYTRWNSVTHDSQLFLLRVDARGRATSEKITAEGFPQSYFPAARRSRHREQESPCDRVVRLSTRTAIGQASIANGSFSLIDSSPVQPLLYLAVYTDPASGIPYAALLRPMLDTISLPGRARRGASGSLNP